MHENEGTSHAAPLPGQRLGAWVRANRWPVLWSLLILAVLPARGLWGPEEAAYAALARDTADSWLTPGAGAGFHGQPVLFPWLLKLTARLSASLPVWALRLPSALAAIFFLLALRRWSLRFLQRDVADLGVLILGSAPLWLWQAQALQPELLGASLLAGSWLCWLGGYLLMRGLKAQAAEGEAAGWFLRSYGLLGLSVLAGGPLGALLTLMLVGAFLLWQKDRRAAADAKLWLGVLVVAGLVAPWYLLARAKAGAPLADAAFLNLDLELATRAPRLARPFHAYLGLLGAQFFPWVLLLPAFVFYFAGGTAHRSPVARFLVLAIVVPLAFLSLLAGKEGRYLLVAYPFLALLVAGMLQPVAVEGVSAPRIRRLGLALAAGLALLGLVAALLGFMTLGDVAMQAAWAPLRPVARAEAALLLLGALSVAARSLTGEGRFLVRETALTLSFAFLLAAGWGFPKADAAILHSAAPRP